MDDIKALNKRIVDDIEGMPWKDPHMTNGQYRLSVLYFIKAYTNDVEKLLKKKEEENATS